MLENNKDNGYNQDFDRMVRQVDWARYKYLDELELKCKQKFLVSSIFHIRMCQRGTYFEKCRAVLAEMYKMMSKAKDLEKSKKNRTQTFSRSDLHFLLKTDQIKKQDIEKSQMYIGYFIFYVLQIFLSGSNRESPLLKDFQEQISEDDHRD